MSGPGAPRTVVFVSAVIGHGGPNASLRMIVPHLAGVQPVLVGPYEEGERDEWQREGVEVVHIPRPRGLRKLAAAAWNVFRALRNAPRDRVVVANGLTEAALVAPSLLLLRVRGLVWIHNYAVPRPARALAPILRRQYERGRWRLAAVSEVAATVGRSVFGPGAEFAIVPNPIRPVDDTSLRARAPAAGGRLRVSYAAGTDRPYKGFDLLPDIIERTDDCGFDWRIVAAVGNQPQAWSRLREVSERLESSQVEIRGRTRRIEELYDGVDVILIPSRQESFCRVAAEAMAFGAAVVAARLPAIEEVCGDVAFYFAPGDAEAAALTLREVAGSPGALAEAQQQGRRVVQRFTPSKVLDGFEGILQSVR